MTGLKKLIVFDIDQLYKSLFILKIDRPSLIAVAQMTATSNKADNLAVSKKLIEEAGSLGAKVLHNKHFKFLNYETRNYS